MPNKRPPSRFSRTALNPAFASAHGIPTEVSNKKKSTSFRNTRLDNIEDISAEGVSKKLKLALRAARATGKLNLSNTSLPQDLPSSIFDLRSDIDIDLSLDRAENSWDCHGEETLTLVDFSDNNLGRLDPRIEKYTSLQTFRARRCNFSSFGDDILSKLDNLTILDLSSNQINGQIHIELLPIGLTELNLSDNSITTLANEDDIIRLPYLRVLDVSQNKITSLPFQMDVENLQNLDISRNFITSIPKRVLTNSLSVLIASENKLSNTPDLSCCKRLRIADLSKNLLRCAPPINCVLERFVLNFNQISSLADILPISSHSNLMELHISDNKLDSFPNALVLSLLKLQFLDVSRNDLKDIPYELGYLPHLRRVRLEGNVLRRGRDTQDIQAWKKSMRKRGSKPDGEGFLEEEKDVLEGTKQIPKDEKQIKTENESIKNMAKSTVSCALGKDLNLTNKGLISITSSFCEKLAQGTPPAGCRVKSIILKKNSLSSIPEIFFDILPNVTTLDLSFNQLQSLPSNIQQVPLTNLLLNRNKLTVESISIIPITPTSCLSQNLTDLNLSSNNLVAIPTNILSDCPHLSTLILSQNRIASIENWKPRYLTSLAHLDLSDNRLTSLHNLPTIWGGCNPKLRILKINNNELAKIPLELGVLSQLQFIDLRGNPQRAIRRDVLDKSCEDVLNYLKWRMDPKEVDRVSKEMLSLKGEPNGGNVEVETTIDDDGVEENEGGECDVLQELRDEIEKMKIELNNVHLSQAKKYAMKKDLAMKKAKLIREERKLKTKN